MSRRRLIVIFLPALAILLAAGGFYALLHTEPGARWLWQRAAGLVPGELRAAAVAGDLQSGLRLGQVSYRDEAIALSVDTLELSLDLDLLPPALSVKGLEFGALEIRQEAAGQEGTGSPRDILAALALPIPVELEEVRGERVAWRGAGDDPGVEIRAIALSAFWFKRLELEQFDLTLVAPAMRLRGAAELGFQSPYPLTLEAGAEVGPAPESGLDEPLALRVQLQGDLGALRLGVQAEEPRIVLSGSLEGLLETPAWDLQLEADRLPWPSDSAEPLLIEQLKVSSYGSIDDYGLEVESGFEGPMLEGLEDLRGRLVGAGDGQGLRIERLDVTSAALALGGAGRLDWGDGFAADGTFELERFDPAGWFQPWGEAAPVRGKLQLAWRDGRVEFAIGELEAPGTVANLTGSGVFDPGSGAVESELGWREFAWPPGAAAPDVVSRTGTARLAGRLDEWSLAADLELEAEGFPAGRLQVRGTGDRQAMALEIPRGEVLGGSLAGAFETRWSPELTWSAVAQFVDLSTAPLAPAWPGRVSGEARLGGRTAPQELDIEIRGLAGVLRERPLKAEGMLQVREGRVNAQDLRVSYGGSEVSLDGDLTAGGGLAFRAHSPSLATLVDGAAGSVAGAGTLSLDPANPYLVLDLQGEGLAWAGYSVEALRVVTTPGDEPVLQAEIEGIAVGDSRVDTLTLRTGSRRPFDRLEAEVGVADARLALRLAGEVADWSAPLAGGWHGSLQQLRLDGEALGWIELEDAAELTLESGAVTLAPACFRGSREGRLCVEGGWRPQGEATLEASLVDVSPNLALTLAGSDLALTQLLSGNVSWKQVGSAEPEATVALDISPGEIRIEGEDQPIISTGRGRFGFEIADGRLFAGNLDIPIPGAGGIDTDFSAPDLSDGLASAVEGRIQVNLRDIGPVLQLIAVVEGSSGPVAADLRFSGTLDDPRLTGHASLVRGRISHFASGLQLEDLQLAGAVYEFDQTELSGTFRAGDGQGSIRAVVNFDNLLEPSVRVELSGENLTLVNVPDLNVRADPDLRLIWREGVLDIAGRVSIPSARVSPRYLPTSGATESPDVVIVAGEDPYARSEQAASPEWSLRGQLEIELGDDVRLQLERARALLGGTATFRWDGQPLPVASGGFNLTGEINAYGQLLKVKEGRVNFADRPADNPFLTVRAEREIFGNSQIRRAGVLVTGTLRRPVLETYTDPMTTRERALALLVTGNDFDYEQGVGAVEVGMYVAPKLFISYGVGLFDDQNVISARYDLGRGFGVKATSGQRETGVDISYTLER